MVKIHVNDVYIYEINEGKLPVLPLFGRNLSARIPSASKPTLVFGQDEAIYRSSQLNESC